MKKIILLSGISLVLFFTSCSRECTCTDEEGNKIGSLTTTKNCEDACEEFIEDLSGSK